MAFVPVFGEVLVQQGREQLQRLFRVTLGLFTVLLLVFCALGMAASPWLVKLFAPGFEPLRHELAVTLTRVLFPYLLLVGLTSLFAGALNTLRHFAAPAAAPILLNIGIVTSALLLSGVVKPPILSMAIGVLAGGVLGMLLQIPVLRARGIRLLPQRGWRHPAVGRMFRLMGPALFGVAVYQVNVLVSRALASLLPEGSVTYLYYSDRFLELPLGVFAVAVATVALPDLSGHAAAGRRDKLLETLSLALRLTLFVCLPAMVWMTVCRVPLIATLLQRGRFGPADTLVTARVFLFAAQGIWAVAMIRNLVPTFYSLKDTRTPVVIAFFAFLLNAACGVLLMGPLGPAGLALANVISAVFNCTWLVIALRRKLGRLGLGRVLAAGARILVAALLAGAVAWPFTGLAVWREGGLAGKLLHLAAAAALAGGVYLLACRLLGVQEMKLLFARRRGVGDNE